MFSRVQGWNAFRGALQRAVPRWRPTIVPRSPDDPADPPEGKGGRRARLTDDQIRDAIKRNRGNSYEAIREHAEMAAKDREARRVAEDKLAKYEREGRIAPDGGVVLQGDTAKAWAAVSTYLSEAKLSLTQLLDLAKETPLLKENLAKSDRLKSHSEAATDMGWNGGALTDVLDLKKLELKRESFREADPNDSKRRIVVERWAVRPVGDEKGDWTPLEDYAEENLQTFMPSLEAESANADDDGGAGDDDGDEPDRPARRQQPNNRPAREPASGGTRWPQQSKGKRTNRNASVPLEDAKKDAYSQDTYGVL